MQLGQKVVLNASALAGGRFAGSALGLVTLAVSTRYLGASTWGQLAAAFAFATIVNSFTDLGLWAIGTREIVRRPQETQRLVGALLTVGFAVSLLGGLVGAGLAFALYGGEGEELTRRAILLLLITVPLSVPLGAVNAYYTAHQKAYIGAAVSLFGSVITLATVVAAVLLDLGFTGIVSAYVIAAAAQTVAMVIWARGKLRLRPALDLPLSKQLTMWTLPIAGSRVVFAIYWRLDIVLLSQLSSDSEVALYFLAFKLVELLTSLPNYLHITIMPELARTARTERFHELMSKTFTVLVVAALGASILSAAFAEGLVALAGGAAFQDAVVVVQILTLAVATAYVTSVFGDAFLVYDRVGQFLRMAVVVMPVNIALNALLIPPWGARGAAVAWVASEMLILVGYLILYRRYIGPLPRVQRAQRIVAAACAMGVVAIAGLLVPAGEFGSIVVLAVGGTVSLAVYVAALYALRAMPETLHENLVVPVAARLGIPLGARG